MIYMRGQREDYDHWAELVKDSSWNWQSVIKRFMRFEDFHGGVDEWHGVGHEWRVEKQRLSWDILEIFKRAAMQSGLPMIEDFNRGNNFGVGYFDVNQCLGWRLNTSKAFLSDDVKNRKNLTILTGAHVSSLNINGTIGIKECNGVNYFQNGQEMKAYASKETILCSGSIGSVQVLERSGIGAAEYLEKLKIRVHADLPGVGENLQDHLQLRMVYKVEGIDTLNKKAGSIFGKVNNKLVSLSLGDDWPRVPFTANRADVDGSFTARSVCM
jgi:choline dehydrogenase